MNNVEYGCILSGLGIICIIIGLVTRTVDPNSVRNKYFIIGLLAIGFGILCFLV